jgi:hypothetical protein
MDKNKLGFLGFLQNMNADLNNAILRAIDSEKAGNVLSAKAELCTIAVLCEQLGAIAKKLAQ